MNSQVDKQNRQKKATTRSRWQYDTDVINQTKIIWLKNTIKADRQRWTHMEWTDITKKIDLNVDLAEFMESPKKLAAKITSTLK
jgi:hypothetical protein